MIENKINLPRPRVGIVGPFSGPRAGYGHLLQEQVQQIGLSEYVDIIWENDKADPICSAQAAHALIKQNLLAVVGHFNSDSALAASEIYRVAGIPLLLPASTALTLSELPLTYRICPNDQDQAKTIIKFINKNDYKRVGVWVDGSPYSLRLKNLLESDNKFTPACPHDLTRKDVLVLLGAHHHVAQALIEFKKNGEDFTALCCDDCSIQEFSQLIGVMKNIFVATPYPDFSGCIQYAAKLIISYIKMKASENFSCWLAKEERDFLKQQYRYSYFRIKSIV